MKTFKTILFTVLLLCLTSCGCSPYNAKKNIEAEFPNSTVYNVPNHRYDFIVVDSIGNIYYVSCLNLTDDDISYMTKIHNVR